MAVTEAQVIDALRPVEDPELHRSIVDLGMVRDVVIDGGSVTVVVALTIAGCPLRAEIDRRVRDAVVALDGVDAAAPEFTVMTDEERAMVRKIMQGDPASTAASQAAHGHAEGRAIPFAQPGSRTRVLLIASGKGGVGKSSVTTNLAVALARRDKSVAVIDADVWGFSIPRMLGIDHRVGTLEVGKDCDLVITDGDILHYETFVQLAVVDGKVVYDKQEELFFAHIRPRSEGALAPVERVDPGEEEVADSGEDEGGDEDDD